MSKPKAPRVLLFSAGRCAYCARTRALLRARGVPVLLIGSRRIDGFQPDAIRQALRQAGLAG